MYGLSSTSGLKTNTNFGSRNLFENELFPELSVRRGYFVISQVDFKLIVKSLISKINVNGDSGKLFHNELKNAISKWVENSDKLKMRNNFTYQSKINVAQYRESEMIHSLVDLYMNKLINVNHGFATSRIRNAQVDHSSGSFLSTFSKTILTMMLLAMVNPSVANGVSAVRRSISECAGVSDVVESELARSQCQDDLLSDLCEVVSSQVSNLQTFVRNGYNSFHSITSFPRRGRDAEDYRYSGRNLTHANTIIQSISVRGNCVQDIGSLDSPNSILGNLNRVRSYMSHVDNLCNSDSWCDSIWTWGLSLRMSSIQSPINAIEAAQTQYQSDSRALDQLPLATTSTPTTLTTLTTLTSFSSTLVSSTSLRPATLSSTTSTPITSSSTSLSPTIVVATTAAPASQPSSSPNVSPTDETSTTTSKSTMVSTFTIPPTRLSESMASATSTTSSPTTHSNFVVTTTLPPELTTAFSLITSSSLATFPPTVYTTTSSVTVNGIQVPSSTTINVTPSTTTTIVNFTTPDGETHTYKSSSPTSSFSRSFPTISSELVDPNQNVSRVDSDPQGSSTDSQASSESFPWRILGYVISAVIGLFGLVALIRYILRIQTSERLPRTPDQHINPLFNPRNGVISGENPAYDGGPVYDEIQDFPTNTNSTPSHDYVEPVAMNQSGYSDVLELDNRGAAGISGYDSAISTLNEGLSIEYDMASAEVIPVSQGAYDSSLAVRARQNELSPNHGSHLSGIAEYAYMESVSRTDPMYCRAGAGQEGPFYHMAGFGGDGVITQTSPPYDNMIGNAVGSGEYLRVEASSGTNHRYDNVSQNMEHLNGSERVGDHNV